MPAESLWFRCRQLVSEAAERLIDPRARFLASSVQWWELPGHPERWPVAVFGEGPPLLIIGGFDGSILDATPLAILLARNYQLLIPDVYGFGFCPRPSDGNYSPEGILVHLEGVLSCPSFWQTINSSAGSSDSGGRVSVIGASMGTRVAIDLARRLPDRIERLLLLGPVGLSEPPVEQPGPPLLEALSLWLLGLHWVRRWLRRFMHAHAKQSCTAGELEICSVHLATPGWRKSLRSFGRSGGFGYCDLPLPAQPILAILGKDDQLVRSRQRQLVGKLLGSNLIELDACGHLPQWEHPEQVAKIWNDWLSDDSGA